MEYKKWSKLTVPSETIKVRRDIDRDVFSIKNTKFWVDTIVPHNWFKNIYTITYIDIIIPFNINNQNFLKEHGGHLIPAPYAEDGYQMICFKDKNNIESIELAYNFLNDHKDIFLKLNKISF